MAWYDDVWEYAKENATDLIKIGGSAGKAYLDYKDQKRRNEIEEAAYRDYLANVEAAGQEAQAAVDLNLTPMTVTGVPTSKADVTDFTALAAKGGIIGLKNGGDPNAGITALRKKAPGVVKRMGFESGSDEDGVAIQEAEGDTVTFGTYDGNISFPRKENESQEMAILNGLFNDVEGKVDEETKMQYYKILIPQVYKNGEISKDVYEKMIQEIIINKAKGGIANLRKKYSIGSGPDDTDGTVKIEDAVEEVQGDMQMAKGSFNNPPYQPTQEAQDAAIEEIMTDTAYLTGEGTWGIDRAMRIWTILPDDIQSGYGNDFMNFFESTDWHGVNMKKGGRVKRDNGGIMNLGGLEKDYRFNGGFVPIGEYEKKDDVPARLSKNEFVFTADAVRAAGGGSINKGAKRMYDTMKKLEAKPTAKRMTA